MIEIMMIQNINSRTVLIILFIRLTSLIKIHFFLYAAQIANAEISRSKILSKKDI
jgi:hypothetical protein